MRSGRGRDLEGVEEGGIFLFRARSPRASLEHWQRAKSPISKAWLQL